MRRRVSAPMKLPPITIAACASSAASDDRLGVAQRAIRVDAHEVGAREAGAASVARRLRRRASRRGRARRRRARPRARPGRSARPSSRDEARPRRPRTRPRGRTSGPSRSISPRRNPFVSGGRLYGGSGSAARIVTDASPPAARYSVASRAAARPPPTTTIGSTAMTNEYPFRAVLTHGRFSARERRPRRLPFARWPCSPHPASARSSRATPSSTGSRSGCAAATASRSPGPNGAGKTTLLRALVGETSLTAGELAFAKDTRVALHDQRPPRGQGLTLREYSLSGAGDLVAIEEELTRLEQAMASGDHAPATLRRYSEAQARLEHAGGWAWRDRAASILRGLGFRDADLDRPLDTFSGGELTRASLARALSADPDLLLLDEPTNHLDVESLEWLERELTSLDAAVVLVAHDRWFLEAVTTAVLELGGPKPFFFDGAWHAWRREKAARASAAATQLDRVSDDIERLERFVARFRYKKSKAKQAQAKLSQIGRLEKERRAAAEELESMTKRRRTLGFEFLKPARTGRIVLEADDLVVSAGDKLLLDGASRRARAGGARRARRAERIGQDDAPRDAPRLPGAGRGAREARPRRRSRVLLPARGGAAGPRLDPRRRRLPRRGSRDRRRRTSSAGSSSPAGRRTRSRSRCSRAASGDVSRSRSSSPRARTCSCSTSRRTTSTSRAARRSRRRSRRSPGRCCSSRTTAPSSMPSPTASSPSRTLRSARTTAAGPT